MACVKLAAVVLVAAIAGLVLLSSAQASQRCVLGELFTSAG